MRDTLPGAAPLAPPHMPEWGNSMMRTFDRNEDSRAHHMDGSDLYVKEPLKPRAATPDPTLSARPQRTLPTKFTQDKMAAEGMKHFVDHCRFYTPGKGYNSPDNP